MKESERIQAELDGLVGDFAEDGIVRTILRERIEEEKLREEGEEEDDIFW